jgi:hypothetical protein
VLGTGILEPGSEQWTFGQVIAIALLFAPAVALVEGFFTGELQHLLSSTSKQDLALMI